MISSRINPQRRIQLQAEINLLLFRKCLKKWNGLLSGFTNVTRRLGGISTSVIKISNRAKSNWPAEVNHALYWSTTITSVGRVSCLVLPNPLALHALQLIHLYAGCSSVKVCFI